MEDEMAENRTGLDWLSIIKTLLSSNSSNSSEVTELCLKIIKSELEIFHHKENRLFYNSFAVLTANYICKNANHLSISQLEIAKSASQLILKYLLEGLQDLAKDSNANSLFIDRNLKAIRSLCVQSTLLSAAEITTITNTMKGENVPTNFPLQESDYETIKQDTPKTRLDLSSSIFEQLTFPLKDSLENDHEKHTNISEALGHRDPTIEMNKLFLKLNTESLQSLRAGDTLIDLCLNLPAIKNAHTKITDALAGKPFGLPVNHVDATTVRNSLNTTLADVMLASSAINLPVLEPLTPCKLEKLCNLSMAVLYCAISHTTSSAILSIGSSISPKCVIGQPQPNNKEDEFDVSTVSLVEETLTMYAYIANTIKNSTRAGGYMYQNHLLAGTWVLISGLQTHITNTTASVNEKPHLREREDKGRSPSKSRDTGSTRSTLLKFQQTFGVLFVALANRMLSMMSELFDDLYLEVCSGGGSIIQVEPAPLTILGQFTSLQRIATLLGAVPVNQLLFYLVIVSYRKASSLKRIHPPEGDTFSQSDSTTYYEDMIMCSDESSTDEDDDSEPILGQWFEETLAPPDNADNKSSAIDNTDLKSAQTERVLSIVPDKGEAHGFIKLATQIFTFLNRHFLCSKSAYVTRYLKNGLTEHQIVILAAIIKDLDRETARTESGTISVYFGPSLGQLYDEFSRALSRFTHNLVTHSSLRSHQAQLLGHLGISPWNTEVPHAWPLQVYSRSLAVLAQVLLLRAPNEKEASVISIWHRLVNTLIENVINPPSVLDSENDDLNVEHAQVLLYLFHALNLMQKKSVLLLMAGGVIRCSEVSRGCLKDSQLLHLSRLLLLFDYIMKHLYDAPPTLLEQNRLMLTRFIFMLSKPLL